MFSIDYEGVPSAESLILQHEIEEGYLEKMPVELKDITVDIRKLLRFTGA